MRGMGGVGSVWCISARGGEGRNGEVLGANFGIVNIESPSLS